MVGTRSGALRRRMSNEDAKEGKGETDRSAAAQAISGFFMRI